MSNSTNDFTINLINNITLQVNRYMTLLIFLFGTIGNLLNIIVFIQPALRLNPCAVYFLGSSASGLGIILVGLPSRIIAGWTLIDPASTNSWFCKTRIFLLYSCRTTLVWLLVFATIDRWFSSSAELHRRRLSSYKNAFHSMLIIAVLSFILWIEIIICYDADVTHAPLKCYGKTDACRMLNDIIYASSTVMIPSLLMLIFGLLTIRNIHRSYRAIQPVRNTTSATSEVRRGKRSRNRRSEASLTRMLLLQIILLTLCSMPQAIHQFYLSFTINANKTLYRIAIENFIVNLDFLLTYVGNGISFYIYTLHGTVFRQTLLRIIQTCARQLKFN